MKIYYKHTTPHGVLLEKPLSGEMFIAKMAKTNLLTPSGVACLFDF